MNKNIIKITNIFLIFRSNNEIFIFIFSQIILKYNVYIVKLIRYYKKFR